jgi:hypothetical protein
MAGNFVSLQFGQFILTLGIENGTNSSWINSLKPKMILPTETPKPKAMMIKIGEIMGKLKKGDCPDFLLKVKVGEIVAYDDYTYS